MFSFHTLLFASLAACASLKVIDDFGPNPTNITMYMYVPDHIQSDPAIIVALHPCGGTAQFWYTATRLPSLAEQHNYILVYPETPHMSRCWDVQNVQSLTHGQGGDAGGIISMVQYALNEYKADTKRVFVMGGSSGAMMTNVLAASYPNVFAAAAAYSGTAAACFLGSPTATPAGANQTCAQGRIEHTPAEWGDFVRNSYPGYDGRRPRMLIAHGLADTLVSVSCAYQALAQWSDVLGVAWTRNVTGVPTASYTQLLYGDHGHELQGFLGRGVGHIAPVNETVLLGFFGL